jgi:cystathionine beta-lyase/cystathionine gamma-synthase
MPDPNALSLSQPVLGLSSPLVPPIFQSAVYTLPDLDALDKIMTGDEPGFVYARDAHPNARLLAEQLAVLEGATWAAICASGMAAISAAVLAVTQQGDRLVASNRLYGKTAQLFRDELVRYGITAEFLDASDAEQVRSALGRPARLLFVETMSNPMLRLTDLAAMAALAHDCGCILAVDNTFATPILTRPLDLGADLVIESLTKMIGGHSDVTLGLVCGRGDLGMQVGAIMSTWGLSSNPFDCWLTCRGLASLPLRTRAASANAAQLAAWLTEQREVQHVIYPGLPDHPDHDLARRLLTDGFGNMLCMELSGGRAAVNRFVRQAPAIPFSPSLGHSTTTLSHPATTSHRHVSPAEKRRQGITDGLIRLSVGVEEVAQVRAHIARGLA